MGGNLDFRTEKRKPHRNLTPPARDRPAVGPSPNCAPENNASGCKAAGSSDLGGDTIS